MAEAKMLRRVLMSHEIAEILGVAERWTLTEAVPYEGGMGVVDLAEGELLVNDVVRIEWNEPDAKGYYTPTLYTATNNPVLPRAGEPA